MVGLRDRYEIVSTIIEILPDHAMQLQPQGSTDSGLTQLKRVPDSWAVTPSRSRADWAF
jgi:hypothetical protein